MEPPADKVKKETKLTIEEFIMNRDLKVNHSNNSVRFLFLVYKDCFGLPIAGFIRENQGLLVMSV